MAKAKPTSSPDKLSPTQGKEKTSLYIQLELLSNLKYIEYKDDRTRTDIVNEALTDYIAKWEKKNGPVPKKP
jgi:hypothetical protein